MNTLSKEKFIPFYEKYMTIMAISGNLMFALQIQKIIMNKSSADVSLEGFLIAFISIASWLLYGILKKDKVLIRANVIGLICSSLCLMAIIMFK